VELGARHVDWHPFDHPELGKVELGGWRRETDRVPPPFMIEEMLHRNMAFVLFNAERMPVVRAEGATARPLGGGLFEVDAVFRNEAMIPTRSQRSADKKIGSPDRAIVTVEQGDVKVVSAGLVDRWANRVVTAELRRPADLRIEQGIDGDGAVRIRWLVHGTGKIAITYRSEKGGTAATSVELR
jgi:hypothetical protein